MPKKITIMGYTIKELEPKVRQEVIDKHCEINTNYDWYDGCYEGFHETLAEYGLECKNFGWDLYHNEFEFNNLGIENRSLLLSKLEIGKYLIPLQMVTNGEYDIDIDLKDKCVIIDIQDDTNIKREELTEIEDAISEIINNLVEKLEEDFLKILKDDYDYATSEEAIVESLEANDYLFTKEGKAI